MSSYLLCTYRTAKYLNTPHQLKSSTKVFPYRFLVTKKITDVAKLITSEVESYSDEEIL